MRYSINPQREQWWRIAALVSVVVVIILGIVLISRCSRTTDKTDPPLYPEDSLPIMVMPAIEPSLSPEDKGKVIIDTDAIDEETGENISETPIYTEEPDVEDWSELDEGDNDDEGSNWLEPGGESPKKTPLKKRVGKNDTPGSTPGSGYNNPGKNQPNPKGGNSGYRPQRRNSNESSQPPILPKSPKDYLPIWIAVLVVLLVFYILATIVSRGGVLIIWATTFDKLLVIVSAVLFFIAMFIEDAGGSPQAVITLYSFSGLLMLVSITLSIIYNMGNLWNIFLSILAKCFVFLLTNITCLFIIIVLLIYFMIKIARNSRDM